MIIIFIKHDNLNDDNKFEFSKIKEILNELKILFEKRGYQQIGKNLIIKTYIKHYLHI